jgi:hypothetical protein
MADHIKHSGPMRKIGTGRESHLSEHMRNNPGAPLFAVVEARRVWSEGKGIWLTVADVVTGETLAEVARKYDDARGCTRKITGVSVDRSTVTGFERTVLNGWSVSVEYAGGFHSGFVVGLATEQCLLSLANGTTVDAAGNDVFSALLEKFYAPVRAA